MRWPSSQEYNEAIQNPAGSFADPDLRDCQVRTNALGLPVPCSGSFADVYQLRKKGRAWAIKCFTREVPELQQRYAKIGAHLQEGQLPFTVAFRCLQEGIRVRGHWYPVLKMDWIEGLTLNDFVKQNADKPQVLEKLAQLWVSLARQLREANIAHGDLQHGNVLLAPGRKAGSLAIKLVDYDGMFVPSLANQPSGEVGHPAYQHPQRVRELNYHLETDRFSVLVIYCAIRSVAVGGRSIWERYDNGDNLLFREQDLRNPHESALFAELARANDSGVQRLAACVGRAAYAPLDRTPLLEEAINTRSEQYASGAVFDAVPVIPHSETAESQWTATPPPVRTSNPKAVPTTEQWHTLADPPIDEVPVRDDQAPKTARRPRTNNRLIALGAAGVTIAMVTAVVAAVMAQKLASEVRSLKSKVLSLQDQIDNSQRRNLQQVPLSPTMPRAEQSTEQPQSRSAVTDTRPFSNFRPPQIAPQQTPGYELVWEVKKHMGARMISNPGGPVVFSPDGARCAWTYGQSRQDDQPVSNDIFVFDVHKKTQIQRLQGHTRPVMCLAFSADSGRLLSGSSDKTVRLWDVTKGDSLAVMEGHKATVAELALSSDGRRAASVSRYNPLDDAVSNSIFKIWDLESYREMHSHSYSGLQGLSFVGRGLLLCVVNHDNASTKAIIDTYDSLTGQRLRAVEFKTKWLPTETAISFDGRYAATTYGYRGLHVWRIADGAQVHQFDPSETARSFSDVTFAKGGSRLFALSERTLHVWDVDRGEYLCALKADLGGPFAVSPDCRHVLYNASSLSLWRLPDQIAKD